MLRRFVTLDRGWKEKPINGIVLTIFRSVRETHTEFEGSENWTPSMPRWIVLSRHYVLLLENGLPVHRLCANGIDSDTKTVSRISLTRSLVSCGLRAMRWRRLRIRSERV